MGNAVLLQPGQHLTALVKLLSVKNKGGYVKFPGTFQCIRIGFVAEQGGHPYAFMMPEVFYDGLGIGA